MTDLPFVKMHGLGNDFIILDFQKSLNSFNKQDIKKLSDRRLGIGCDQLIILERPHHPHADVLMRIYNADGNEVGACGNATRCVGLLLKEADNKRDHIIETKAGLLSAEVLNQNQVTVDLGKPSFSWQDIPLSQEIDTLDLPINIEGMKDPIAVSVGNPHLVFFVYDTESINLQAVGQQLNTNPLFPEGINIEVVEKVDSHTLRMRVYERGVGITPACGTGAAASVIGAKKRGLIQTPAKVILDGGELTIDYQETVKVTGQVMISFRGFFNTHILQS
jgi:diaminopimelate epimerase